MNALTLYGSNKAVDVKISTVLVLTASLGLTAPAVAQDLLPDSLPEGVHGLTIADGKTVFAGPGICTVCHGKNAKGLEHLGSDLTDDVWVHSDGSYEGIINTLKKGAWAESGTAMPHQKATSLNNQQLEAVAAYVWSLSRMRKPTER